jgi:hypothetical protein
MPTREEIQARLAQIDERKAQALKALQAQRVKLKAKLAQLDRPTKSQRRLDARRKILVGAFVLEQLERTGSTPEALTFEGRRFADWLVRDNDRAAFDGLAAGLPAPAAASPASPGAQADTPLNVPFAEKDQAKVLGAIWQPEQKRWVVPAGLELEPFKDWLG